MEIDPLAYKRLFEIDSTGQKVFQELCRRFYDIQSFDKDNSYNTAFKEGQRHVLAFIINRMAYVPATEETEGSE